MKNNNIENCDEGKKSRKTGEGMLWKSEIL